jgi:hypothetical protein
METKVMTITPQMAEQFLLSNNKNRVVNARRVNLYAHEILQGQWKLNGESIKFDKGGNLVDGQHRLKAIVAAKCPIESIVVFGLDSEVMATIDTGKPRNSGDIFKLNQILNHTTIAAAISKYLSFKSGSQSLSSHNRIAFKISIQDELDTYNMRPDYWQNVFHEASRFYDKNYRIISKSDYVATYAYFNDFFDSKIIDSFFSTIYEKQGVGLLILDKFLSDINSKRKMLPTEKTALLFKAFMFFVNGKKPLRLTYAKDEEFPVIKVH